MVDIPRSPGRRVLGGAGPQARMRISQDFTAGLRAQQDAVRTLRAGVQEGQAMLLHEQEEKERSELTAADAVLSKRENDLLYAKDTGAFNKRGKNAEYLREEVGEKYNEAVKEIEGTISTPRARQAFKQRAAGRYGDVDRNVQRHVSQEMGRHDEEVTKNYIEAEYNAAITAGVDEFIATGNRDVIEKSVGRQMGALLKHGMKYGMDPKVLADRQDEVVSRTHRAVAMTLLDAKRPDAAKEYLKTYRTELVGEDRRKTELAVAKWADAGTARELVDGFMQEATSFKDLMEKARAIKDPDVRKEAEEYSKTRWHEKEYEDRETYNANVTAGFKAIDNGGDQAESLEQAIGPKLWLALPDTKSRETLGRAWRIKKGLEAPVTNNEVYYALKHLGSNEDTRREFLQTNLLEHRHELTQQDFQELTVFQTGLLQKDGKAEREAKGFLSKEALINARADTITDKKKRMDFKKFIDREIQLWQEDQTDPTKLPPKEQIEKMMKDVILEQGGWWSGGKSTVFQPPSNEQVMDALNRKDEAVQEIDRQQPGLVGKIIKVLEEGKRPVNPDAILDLYARWKGASSGR